MRDEQAISGHIASARMTVDGGYTVTVAFSTKEDARLARQILETGDSVAIAKIVVASAGVAPRKPHNEGAELVKLAGQLCRKPEFWEFTKTTNESEAREFMLNNLSISSRSEIKDDPDAAAGLHKIRKDFLSWLSSRAKIKGDPESAAVAHKIKKEFINWQEFR